MSELQRIMYVDDDPDIYKLAKFALEEFGGFTVQICSSGEEALSEVSNFSPDLILLDIMMPGMSGLEILKRLREIEQLDVVPVVFLSAIVHPSELAKYVSLGARDVIAKPFNPMTLADKVRAIWNA